MSKWLYFGFRKWVFSTHPVVPWLVMSACSYYLRPNIKEVTVSNWQAIILSNSWHSVIYLKKKKSNPSFYCNLFYLLSKTCFAKECSFAGLMYLLSGLCLRLLHATVNVKISELTAAHFESILHGDSWQRSHWLTFYPCTVHFNTSQNIVAMVNIDKVIHNISEQLLLA